MILSTAPLVKMVDLDSHVLQSEDLLESLFAHFDVKLNVDSAVVELKGRDSFVG